MDIRELQGDDVQTLVALFDAVLPGFATSVAADLGGPHAFLHDETSFALGAYVDESPVGLAWGL